MIPFTRHHHWSKRIPKLWSQLLKWDSNRNPDMSSGSKALASFHRITPTMFRCYTASNSSIDFFAVTCRGPWESVPNSCFSQSTLPLFTDNSVNADSSTGSCCVSRQRLPHAATHSGSLDGTSAPTFPAEVSAWLIMSGTTWLGDVASMVTERTAPGWPHGWSWSMDDGEWPTKTEEFSAWYNWTSPLVAGRFNISMFTKNLQGNDFIPKILGPMVTYLSSINAWVLYNPTSTCGMVIPLAPAFHAA